MFIRPPRQRPRFPRRGFAVLGGATCRRVNLETKIDIARRYALAYREQLESGEISKKALARVMMNETGVFKDLENARERLRTATGASVNNSPPAYEFKSTIGHGLKQLSSHAKPTEPYKLEPGKWAVLSDIHFPYHSEAALEVTHAYIGELGVQDILLNGDILDCYQLSRFDRDPAAAPIHVEIDMLKQYFEFLRESFSGRIVWKMGNHEDRWERYLRTNAPELTGLAELSLAHLARVQDYGIEIVGSRQLIQAGNLNIVHGHEFGESTFSPVNPARGLFLRAKCSTLAGHNHQTSEHHENNLKDDSMACWSTGCLCDLRPNYRPFAFTKWNHGFAIVDVREDGGFTVQNKRIIGGRVH